MMIRSLELALGKTYRTIHVIVRRIQGLDAGARHVTSVMLDVNLHNDILTDWAVYGECPN